MSRQLVDRQPLGWPIRCLFLVAAACLAGLLVVARKLEPEPRRVRHAHAAWSSALSFPHCDGTAVPDLRHDHLVRMVVARADRPLPGKLIQRGACTPC